MWAPVHQHSDYSAGANRLMEHLFHPFTSEQVERFWSKVDKKPGQGPGGDCWEWTAGKKNKEGYGGYYLKQIDNTINCHKFVFLLVHNFGLKDIPDELVIRHLCDNAPCVRPEHLAIGNVKHNSQDMVRAGKSRKGEKSNLAKLNWDKVREIRKIWATDQPDQRTIAFQFSISTSMVNLVVNNRVWMDSDYSPPPIVWSRRHFRCKFSDEQVGEILALRQQGVGTNEILSKFGMSRSQFYNIVHGRQRKR